MWRSCAGAEGMWQTASQPRARTARGAASAHSSSASLLHASIAWAGGAGGRALLPCLSLRGGRGLTERRRSRGPAGRWSLRGTGRPERIVPALGYANGSFQLAERGLAFGAGFAAGRGRAEPPERDPPPRLPPPSDSNGSSHASLEDGAEREAFGAGVSAGGVRDEEPATDADVILPRVLDRPLKPPPSSDANGSFQS